jgi:hypothetical protein
MSLIEGLEEYDVNMFEYGHLTTKTPHNAHSFKLYIPKIMATFGMGSPKSNNKTFNNKIFLNDNACKPVTAKSVTVQNYITVERHLDRDFSMRADSAGYLHSGQKFIVHMMDKNIRDHHISHIM